MLRNMAQIQANCAFYSGLVDLEGKPSWFPEDYPFLLDRKKAHWWIWGPPNSGKTTLWQSWKGQGAKIFLGPFNNDWVGFNNLFDIIVFDGFKGQLTIQELELLCDPEAKLNVKGGSFHKTKRTMVVVFSNYSIRTCFEKALEKDSAAVDPLFARFTEKQL